MSDSEPDVRDLNDLLQPGVLASEAVEKLLADTGILDGGVIRSTSTPAKPGKSWSDMTMRAGTLTATVAPTKAEFQGQHPNAVWMDEEMGVATHIEMHVPTPEKVMLLGRTLYVDDSESTPDGDFALIAQWTPRPDGTMARKVDGWKCSRATYAALREQSPDSTARAMNRLKLAEMKGETVVQGVVRTNARRPTPAAPKPNRGNMADLCERTKRLVVQIAVMSDSGPIPDGQVGELSKSYAALQAELDEALEDVDSIRENLSIIRAVMIEQSDPRGA